MWFLRTVFHFVLIALVSLKLSVASYASASQSSDGGACHTALSVSASSVLISIEDLDISKEAKDVLLSHGLVFIGDVITNQYISWIRFFKESKNIDELTAALEQRGLRLGMKVRGWQLPVFILPIDHRYDRLFSITHSRINEYKEKLKRAGIASIGDLVSRQKKDLLKVHGIGPVFVKEIEYEISSLEGWRLQFGMEIHEWPPSPERFNQLAKQLKNY